MHNTSKMLTGFYTPEEGSEEIIIIIDMSQMLKQYLTPRKPDAIYTTYVWKS